MRIGPLEIILVIALIIAAAVIVRVARTGKRNAPQNEPGQEVVSSPPRLTARARSLNRTGIILVVAGIIALIAAASFFRTRCSALSCSMRC